MSNVEEAIAKTHVPNNVRTPAPPKGVIPQTQTVNQKEPAKQIKRVVLTTVEDFKLNTWMHQRTPTYGETPADILREAADLRIDGLNIRHIEHRLDTFGNALPKATPPVTPATLEEQVAALNERVRELERFKYHFAEWFTNGNVSDEVRNSFMAFYAETDFDKL